MRQLIYVLITHDMPHAYMWRGYERVRDNLRNILESCNNDVYEALVREHSASPIHKIYLDSYRRSARKSKVPKRHNTEWIPYRMSLSAGSRLMPTEHDTCMIANEVLYRANIPELDTKTVLSVFRQFYKNSPYLYRVLRNLCKDEEKFDILRLRDKYIARNIDRTLREGERAALLIGEFHKVDSVLHEIGSDIAISYLDGFRRRNL